VSKNAKISKNRHPGVCRGPEDVDSIDPTALDPGLAVTPEWWYPGRGDGVFFNTLLRMVGGPLAGRTTLGLLLSTASARKRTSYVRPTAVLEKISDAYKSIDLLRMPLNVKANNRVHYNFRHIFNGGK
jgi:hypothetical protein